MQADEVREHEVQHGETAQDRGGLEAFQDLAQRRTLGKRAAQVRVHARVAAVAEHHRRDDLAVLHRERRLLRRPHLVGKLAPRLLVLGMHLQQPVEFLECVFGRFRHGLCLSHRVRHR